MTLKNKLLLGALAAIILLGISVSSRLFEHVNAGQICIIQAPISGKLTIHMEQGLKWQGFGTVSMYQKESEYSFSHALDKGSSFDESIPIRFNDGGKARISGSFRYGLPKSEDLILDLHTKYGSQTSVDQELVRTVIEKAVYMTGPLMSSKESSSEKRNALLSYIEDQAKIGVYRTRVVERLVDDPLSGKKKPVAVTELVTDSVGNYLRADESPLSSFGINIYNLSLNRIKYDETIERQIAEQQNATMRVQTAIAEAREAEQQAIKAESEGKAEAARARAEMEVIKVKAVTEAEKKRDVALLAMEAAEFYKKEQMLIGEGDAARKRLAAQANGSLEQRLEAYMAVQKYWADAFSKSQQPFVPSIVMGEGTAQSSSAGAWMDMMMMKAARDLQLDMRVQK
ncbi:SPFH domain-containing protein [Pontibacter sp. G13]|uniref:SPFH domain-containing protein n=1 Tax=Pontibacter sp. G13 TaxID=3074898 RepID=UPI0028898FBD|nr:SPFH domain-containing protein [Pontibacter sp. G13]WNJ16696.1 SPFH domain-containing protein [Pontibacter sp. G13]